MSPTPADRMAVAVAASPLLAEYGTAVDPPSARDILEQRAQAREQATRVAATGQVPVGQVPVAQRLTPEQRAQAAAQKQFDAQLARTQKTAAAQSARDANAGRIVADRAARAKAKAADRRRKEAVGAGLSVAKMVIGKLFGSTRG